MPLAEPDVAFRTTDAFPFFDYFRVPYRVAGPADPAAPLGVVTPAGVDPDGGRRLLWVRAQPPGARSGRLGIPGRYELAGFPVVGSVAPDEAVREQVAGLGGDWRPAEPISDAAGGRVGSVWRDERTGSALLPFDPGELMLTLWSERYRALGSGSGTAAAKRAALRAYYLLRPALPRPVQLRLRRAFTRVQGRSSFPRWPVEDALYDLYDWLFALLAELAGRPVPWLDLWPDGRSWALVLTHDVETDVGYGQRHLLRDPERELGYRSSWNFVAQRYQVEDSVIRAVQEDGCEVGVHGLRHDGRDLGSERLLRRRLPEMRKAAQRWDAVGFRSPATQRRWEWMPRLGFDYDTSSTDTDPYEPQPGGCCTTLPFLNQELVELPITLPQDHTLFTILGRPDGELWLSKARHIRSRGGMVLVLTHPDYAGDERIAHGYRALLAEFRDDPTMWHALPREVADWWRRRASSTLHSEGGEWRVAGPAAGTGRVRYAGAGSTARVSG